MAFPVSSAQSKTWWVFSQGTVVTLDDTTEQKIVLYS
jgi:hypothetical protein